MRGHLPARDDGGMDPAPQRHGAHTVLTGLLDRSALYGVLAEIEALGLDLLEVRQLAPDRESPGSGDAAHRDGR
jgi:hypothetical protein